MEYVSLTWHTTHTKQKNVGDSVRAVCGDKPHVQFGRGRLMLLSHQDLASYLTSACGKAAYTGKGNKECSYQITSEEHVICDHPKKYLVCFMIEANEEFQ